MAGRNWVRVVLVEQLRQRCLIHAEEVVSGEGRGVPEAEAVSGTYLLVAEQLEELIEAAGG